MVKNKIDLIKNKKSLKINFSKSIFIILIIACFSFIVMFNCFNDVNVLADTSHYTPALPSGVTNCNINQDYEYTIDTFEAGSCWMFDWGDGNFSDWIEVKESDIVISQTHSWDSYGVYEVRVRHRSIYLLESLWSPPLIVTIAIPPDLDNDSWNNVIEESYDTDPKDPNDFPVDTDNDKIPDDDSLDGKYIGDSDDDGDFLSDICEGMLGSNPKDNSDVITIVPKDTVYYLVDTNGDGKSNILYNPQINRQTKASVEDGITYFDITGDGLWDHIYFNEKVGDYQAPFPWLYLIVAVVIILIFVIFLLFKSGLLYLYEVEYVIEK